MRMPLSRLLPWRGARPASPPRRAVAAVGPPLAGWSWRARPLGRSSRRAPSYGVAYLGALWALGCRSGERADGDNRPLIGRAGLAGTARPGGVRRLDRHVRHCRNPEPRRTGRWTLDELRRDVRRHRPPRPRRRRASTSTPSVGLGMRRLSHHRPRDRPAAGAQRGRHGLGRLQRRDLQLPRAAARPGGARPHASARRPTPR